jgi:methionyl-tRNA formyltransferase
MTTNPESKIPFVFFGTGQIARYVLDELQSRGFRPLLVITSPDAPQGRGMQVRPSLVSEWAMERGIEALKPEHFDDAVAATLREAACDLFIVADYGKILPKATVDMPKRGTLNVHPSLLPRLRGPSPIRTAILSDEKNTGVTIMQLDEKMDHGPIIAQRPVAIAEWPPHAADLEARLARAGGALLAEILPLWIKDEIIAQPQNHDVATYTTLIKKEDAEIDLSGSAYANLLKIRAFEGWPIAFAYFIRSGKEIRVKILGAHIDGDTLVIERVIPEGKKEMTYDEFLRSGARPR